eukprot:tig00000227_g19849.t1
MDKLMDARGDPSPRRVTVLQIGNIVGFIGVVIVNALAGGGRLRKSNAAVSDSYPTKFTPAGWAFSIWGIIYLFCSIFVIYQALPSSRAGPRSELLFSRRGVGGAFLLSCFFNIIWSIVFPYEVLWLSVILIFCLLASLLRVYVRCGVGLRPRETIADFVAVDVTFSLYSAWLSVACVANTALWLYALGWRGGPISESAWSVVVMCVAVAIAGVNLVTRLDDQPLGGPGRWPTDGCGPPMPPFPSLSLWLWGLVIAWALAAISSKHRTDPTVSTAAQVLSLISAVTSCVALFAKFWRWRSRGFSPLYAAGPAPPSPALGPGVTPTAASLGSPVTETTV